MPASPVSCRRRRSTQPPTWDAGFRASHPRPRRTSIPARRCSDCCVLRADPARHNSNETSSRASRESMTREHAIETLTVRAEGAWVHPDSAAREVVAAIAESCPTADAEAFEPTTTIHRHNRPHAKYCKYPKSRAGAHRAQGSACGDHWPQEGTWYLPFRDRSVEATGPDGRAAPAPNEQDLAEGRAGGGQGRIFDRASVQRQGFGGTTSETWAFGSGVWAFARCIRAVRLQLGGGQDAPARQASDRHLRTQEPRKEACSGAFGVDGTSDVD